MANHSADNLMWMMRISRAHGDFLGQIRHWTNVKIALKDGMYWLKDFTPAQILSAELKSIPFREMFYVRENKLFPEGSNLPAMKIPASLLWTPIENGLSITLPGYNHHFFGIHEKLTVQLELSEHERPAFALLTTLDVLHRYVEAAPAVRLKNLSWVMLDGCLALVLGTPLLPVEGKTFWKRENMLLPTGRDINARALAKTISSALGDTTAQWILWEEDGYSLIPVNSVQPLSLSSFRLSIQKKVTLPA